MSSEFVVDHSYNSDRRSPARYIFSHITRHKLVLTTLVLGAFSNAALASTVPHFIGQAFDALQEYGDAPDVALPLIATFALSIVIAQGSRSFLQLLRNFSAEVFAQRIERDVRDELYASLLGKSMTFHDMQPVGDIMARVTNDVRELNFMMNPGFNMIVGSSMFLFVPLVSSPLIYPQLIIVPIFFVITHLFVQVRFIIRLHPIAQDVRKNFGVMNSRLAEALDGLEVVKGTAQEENETAYFNSLVYAVRDKYIEQGQVEARYLSYFLLGLTFVLGFVHSILLYETGQIEIGQIVAFMGQLYLFGFPVFVSLFALSRIASGYASAGRILAIINEETDLDRNPKGYDEPVKGEIIFENVTFGYGDSDPIIHDISFTVPPGKTVAIVGQTGSGKTTLTKLINRIYDANEGRILVDGVDVRDWNLGTLRSQISIIEQDIFLFSRTIAQNIAFGDDDATREQIVDAAKKAQAHDFIESFPEGYDTKIGQRGVTLSGGQRQRLAIARAFESNPPILILDDSTSAIDSATEDKIQQAIWSAAEGRTTILITHRLSQIRWADHIIVIKQGRIAAQGAHDDLLQNSEIYQRIFARYDEPAEANTEIMEEHS